MKSPDLFLVFFVFGIGTLVEITLSTEVHSSERLYKQGDVILGGLFPLHLHKLDASCSVLRSNVLMYSEAMIYAVEEINKNGTILPNVTLGYDIHDTCGNDQEGVTVASDFVFKNTLRFDPRFLVANACLAQVTSTKQAPILAVIGGLDSRVSVNVANVLQVVDLPQISYGASSAELDTSDFTSFFRTVPVDNFQSRAMAELVKHYQWTCIAIIGVDDWYGRSGVDAFVDAANKTGTSCIVMRQLFPVVDSEALIQQMVTRLKSMDHVQVIILYSLVPQAIKVFEEALRQGLTGRTWIASDGWAESSLIQDARFKPIIQGAIGFGFHAFRFDDFKERILKATPLNQRGPWWNQFWEKEFNCSVANSSSPIHDPCSGQERISLEKYERDYGHGLAPYVRDAVYSVAYGLRALLNCNTQAQSCFEHISKLRPEDLLTSLKGLSFEGMTGHINFQKGEVEAAYDIFNLQVGTKGRFNLVQIGSWNAGRTPKLSVQDDLVQWNNNVKPRITCAKICPPGTYKSTPNHCFWECVPCDLDTVSNRSGSSACTRCPEGFISNHDNSKCEEVPINFVQWGKPWGIGLSILTVGCIVLSFVVFGIVIYHHKTPIIQGTGGILNELLLVFAVLAYVFNLIHLFKLSDLSCRALPPVFYFIYTGGAMVQFLKIYRIRILVNPPTPPTPQQRNKIVLFTSVALWLVPFFFSLTWVLVDPPVFQKFVVSRLEVQAVCSWYKTSVGLVLRYFCAVYLGMILITVVAVAYSTKNLPHGHRFDDAKHVAFSLTVFLITFATFYPGWSILKGPSLTIFACLSNVVAATGTVLCNFAPMLWLIYFFPRHNTESYVRPAPFQVREKRSSTVLSVGGVAIALETGSPIGSHRRGSPINTPIRRSPISTPKRGSPINTPIQGSPTALIRGSPINTPKRGSPGSSPATSKRGSLQASLIVSTAQGSPRGSTRFSPQVKTYV